MDEPGTSKSHMALKFVPQTGKGSKHSLEDEVSTEGSPRKRQKTDGAPKAKTVRVKRVRFPKEKGPSKLLLSFRKAKKEALAVEPKWKNLPSAKLPKLKSIPDNVPETKLRPRLWTTDRDELLAILPEMTGKTCINGISWRLYENPLLILDETTTCFEVSVDKQDPLTLDLMTTRSFTCSLPSEPVHELEESLMSMTLIQDDFKPSLATTESTIPISPPARNPTGPAISLPNVPREAPKPTIPENIPTSITSRPISEYRMIVANHVPLEPSKNQPGRTVSAYSKPSRFENLLHRGEAYLRALSPASTDNLLDEVTGNQFPRYDAPLKIQTKRLFKDELSDETSMPRKEGAAQLTGVALAPPESLTSPSRNSSEPLPPHLNFVYSPEPDVLTKTLNNASSTVAVEDHPMDIDEASSTIPPPITENAADSVSTEVPVKPSDCYIPSPIPQELQALVDAYLFGKPLTTICSNQRVFAHWALLLPKDYGYAMMGYFKVVGVQESRVQPAVLQNTPTTKSKSLLAGQVRWLFRLQWTPGGEECIWPTLPDLKYAWWNPASHLPSTEGPKEPQVLPEESFPTTARYMRARVQHHEYQFCHYPVNEIYYYILPAHLMMPFNSKLSDANFPRGWLCKVCGRMNFQKAIRHRKCSSQQCKDSETLSYYLDLPLLRDPQDRLAVAVPYNVYPSSGVTVKLGKFEDGMQTLSYEYPLPSNLNSKAKEFTAYIKHIFNGNLPRLQEEANELLQKVQLDLQIIRKSSDSGPFFAYSAGCSQSGSKVNDMKWPKVPDCVNQIKDMIVRQARWYAETEEKKLRINHLEILAWVTDGKKRGLQPIDARKTAVVLLCLGCNIVLHVTCRSKKGGVEKEVVAAEQDVQNVDDEDNAQDDAAGWINSVDDPEGPEDEAIRKEPAASPKKKAATPKKDTQAFEFTLVHGDALALFGDEFDYSIKRDGTAFFLLGSCKDAK